MAASPPVSGGDLIPAYSGQRNPGCGSYRVSGWNHGCFLLAEDSAKLINFDGQIATPLSQTRISAARRASQLTASINLAMVNNAFTRTWAQAEYYMTRLLGWRPAIQ